MDFNEGEIIYIDKPLHWTSFDVVKRIRLCILRRIKQKKLKVKYFMPLIINGLNQYYLNI